MTAGDPISREAYAALRVAVLRFKRQEHRRHFEPVVHVGHPAGRYVDFVDSPAHQLDQFLRTEVVAALLSRAQTQLTRPAVWLTRPGVLEPHDVDLQWLAAARAAYAEAGVSLAMVVVTRSGWYDPRSGRRVEWRRVRDRRQGT